jgi:hypothetical protein
MRANRNLVGRIVVSTVTCFLIAICWFRPWRPIARFFELMNIGG